MLPVSFRCTMALEWCARSKLSERLCQINLLETQKSSAVMCIHVCSAFRVPHVHVFDRLIHKFLMNTRLIRLYRTSTLTQPPPHMLARVRLCVRARSHSADLGANSFSTCHTYSRVHLHYPSLERITQLTCLLLARFRGREAALVGFGVRFLCLSPSSVFPGLHG